MDRVETTTVARPGARRWASLMIAAIALAACSDDGGSATTAPATTTPPTTVPATTTPPTTVPATTIPPTTSPVSGPPATSAPPTTAGDGIAMDVGVDATTIRIGILADLSGPLAATSAPAVQAQQTFWDLVNAGGGIAGRSVELVIDDNAGDVTAQRDEYAAMRDTIAMLGLSAGDAPTAAIVDDLVADDVLAIPLTWAAGWALGSRGDHVAELYAGACMESINALAWLVADRGIGSVSIVTSPGAEGEDAAAGARYAAAQLGVEVAFDGTVDGDPSAAIDGIVSAAADLVWVAVDPPMLIALMSGAAARGVEAQWSGTATSYSSDLLGTEIAPLLDLYYVASSRTAPWGWQAPGMSHLVDAMTASQPDLPVSDGYVVGWTQAVLANAILEHAAERRDLTRAGIVAAAREVTTDFGGLAPDQTWAGPPADAAVRATYLADVTLDGYNPGALGEGRGSTGSTPLAGPYVSDVAATPAAAAACFG